MPSKFNTQKIISEAEPDRTQICTRSQSTRKYIEEMIKELMDLAYGSEIDDLSEVLKMAVIAIETKGRLGLMFPEKPS